MLLLCAAGALWLLLSPAAFKRRALALRAERLEAMVHAEWRRNIGWEQWRDGLDRDPSTIEREARKLGYGRPGEASYRIIAGPGSEATRTRPRFPWSSDLMRSAAPVLMLLIAGVIAILFFADLKVEDPGANHRTTVARREETR